MKSIVACILLIIGIFCLGLATRPLFDRFTQKDLIEKSKKLLADSGVADEDRYEHLFISLKEPTQVYPSGAPLNVEFIADNVWGVPVEENRSKTVTTASSSSMSVSGEAEFTATVQSGDVVILEGSVSSADTVSKLTAAAERAAGVKEVKNNLIVGKNVKAPSWEAKAPKYLEHFLSSPGVSRLSADKNGLRLEGQVSAGTRERLTKAASEFGEGFVSNELVVRQPIPSILVVRGNKKQLSLSGLLPSAEVQSKLINLITEANPKIKISNDLKIGDGVIEPWWVKSAENLIPRFFSEVNGEGGIEYWKNHLLISGQIPSDKVAEELAFMAAGFGKPETFAVENDLSVVSSLAPEVNLFRDEQNKLILEGQVSSKVFKDQVLGGLMRHNPNVVVTDNLKVDPSVKAAHWGDPGKLVKTVMFDSEGGMIRFTESGVKLAGELSQNVVTDDVLRYASSVVGKEGTVDSIMTGGIAGNQALPVQEIANSDNIPVQEETPVVVAPKIPEIDFKTRAIYFSSGNSYVGNAQMKSVLELAAFLKQTPTNYKVMVGGYADHLGDKEYNRRLSLRRANAVRSKLISYGVSADKLEVKFFGEDTENTSRSNLWKSRRVELSPVIEG